MKTLVQEYKQVIIFLVKFLGIYIVGNIVYGMYVTAYEPAPDPVTHSVTWQASELLTLSGWPSQILDYVRHGTTAILFEGKPIVSVYEGCNGINVLIIFIGFVLAMGPNNRSTVWFLISGAIVIHLFNLARIVLLFWVAMYLPDFLYFSHKYLFTAFIYLVVLLLWIYWVRKMIPTKK